MENKKIKELAKKIIVMTIISIIFWIVIYAEKEEKSQYLENIDYNVVMNKDGSMRVTETWDININRTNTLFKNFNLSKVKYGDITDVEVKDLTTNQNFEEIMQEMYHVPEGQFYALNISSHKFEIAWGTGMEESVGNKKYEISYTVNDVVTDYKDCQEIYWQFLAKGQNMIPAKKVTGTLILPNNVSNINKIRVWGHGQLNGKIEKINTSVVNFEMENLRAGSMFEIRVITEEKLFNSSNNKIKNYPYLNIAMKEENKWSQEANDEATSGKIFYNVCIIIYVMIILINIIKIIKYKKILSKSDNGIVINKLRYYRDIPRENTVTPGEATYLYNFYKERLETKKVQEKAIAATILNLYYKRKIDLEVIDNNEVNVIILTEERSDLNKDESIILRLLIKAGNKQKKFNIRELTKYAKKKYYEYSNDINEFVNEIRKKLYELKLIDKVEENLYKKCNNAKNKRGIISNIFMFLIIKQIISYIPIFRLGVNFTFGIEYQAIVTKGLIIIAPYIGILLYKYKMQSKMQNKIAVLTQKGSDEKEQWKALARFMKEYSLLKEKEILDLIIWEKYLIYATALGIADKVIEEMKASYPEVFIKENWDEEEMKEKYPIINFVYNPCNSIDNNNIERSINSLSNNISTAYKMSMAEIRAHSSSSSSGRRWRLLRRRRRPVEAGGRNGR